uniref:Uncharacterized protein n=1 Tax=Anguilla anguilla TaxID=7936 RepID=A0A0E9RW98_ANGAN
MGKTHISIDKDASARGDVCFPHAPLPSPPLHNRKQGRLEDPQPAVAMETSLIRGTVFAVRVPEEPDEELAD